MPIKIETTELLSLENRNNFCYAKLKFERTEGKNETQAAGENSRAYD
jgi:hypothetical protein